MVKENVTSTRKTDVDETDSSVTRPMHLLEEIFSEAGLTCFKSVKQLNFPKGLYPVHMFALAPQIISS